MRKKIWQLLMVTVLVGASACGFSQLRETPLKSEWKEVFEDIGKVVAALVRGSFPYSTGQVIMVDGGLTLPRL